MQLRVDASAVSAFTKKLKGLNRSAFPVAVRESLTMAAKDMKTNTLLETSKKSFVNRSSTFFKANSRYEKADGFNVSSMKSKAGFYDNSLKGSPKEGNFAVKDLEEQESGGAIKKKALIPMLAARTGGAKTLVRANARLQKIKNVVIASKMGRSNQKVNFILAAHKAGKGGYFLSKNTLWRVNGLNHAKSSDLKLTPLYSFKKGRSVKVKPHHFVENAGMMTIKKMDDYYIDQAKKQFERALR
jgi:hypothetical protein